MAYSLQVRRESGKAPENKQYPDEDRAVALETIDFRVGIG